MTDTVDESLVSAGGNATIAYDQQSKPYHRLIAELASRGIASGSVKVLDVGCGTGNTLVHLDARLPDATVVIADIDAACLDICKSRVTVEEACLITAESGLSAVSGDFDIIIHSHVLQYDLDPLGTLRDLVGRTRDGGRLIIAVSNAVTLPKIVNNLLRKGYAEGFFTWDRPSFCNLLGKLGPRIARVEIVGDYVPIPFLYRYSFGQAFGRRMARVLPWLCFSFVACVSLKER